MTETKIRLIGTPAKWAQPEFRSWERTRLACRFGRPAQTFVTHYWFPARARKFVRRSFRRAAENCTPAACAPQYRRGWLRRPRHAEKHAPHWVWPMAPATRRRRHPLRRGRRSYALRRFTFQLHGSGSSFNKFQQVGVELVSMRGRKAVRCARVNL